MSNNEPPEITLAHVLWMILFTMIVCFGSISAGIYLGAEEEAREQEALNRTASEGRKELLLKRSSGEHL